MAAGKVRTGFSKPYVAIYTNSDTTVTYSDGQLLARGVSVSLEIETSDSDSFYADNIVAETEAGTFTTGTVTLTVDGLHQAAEKLIMGLADADSDGFIAYDTNQSVPYCGVGWITRYKSGGTVTYVATILPKVAFAIPGEEAETAEDEAVWTTQELEATIYRDDTDAQTWRYISADCTSEDEALALIQAKLGTASEE